MTTPPVSCKHWRDNGKRGAGRCNIDQYGKGLSPSHGTCYLACPMYNGPAHDRNLFRSLVGNGNLVATLTVDGGEQKIAPLSKPKELSRWQRAKHYLNKQHCPSCGDKAKIHTWLGMRWIGYPWPLRWFWSEHGQPGCGCILRLKRWKQAASILLKGKL